jgi:hypothetical protein
MHGARRASKFAILVEQDEHRSRLAMERDEHRSRNGRSEASIKFAGHFETIGGNPLAPPSIGLRLRTSDILNCAVAVCHDSWRSLEHLATLTFSVVMPAMMEGCSGILCRGCTVMVLREF